MCFVLAPQAKPHATQGALVVPQGAVTVYGGLAGCGAVASRVPHLLDPPPYPGPDQRSPFAMKAATMTVERQAFGWRTYRMLSVTNPTLDGQFQSMCQSIRALPNLDKPNLVVCKLALMKSWNDHTDLPHFD